MGGRESDVRSDKPEIEHGYRKMHWAIINFFAYVVAPTAFIWGWIVYTRSPNRRTWRMHASLLGLLGPVLSVVVWVIALAVANVNAPYHRTPPRFVAIGTWIPIVGTLVALIGRPKIAIATLLASVGAILFWFGTTLP